jgi:hypothetical protein
VALLFQEQTAGFSEALNACGYRRMYTFKTRHCPKVGSTYNLEELSERHCSNVADTAFQLSFNFY